MNLNLFAVPNYDKFIFCSGYFCNCSDITICIISKPINSIKQVSHSTESYFFSNKPSLLPQTCCSSVLHFVSVLSPITWRAQYEHRSWCVQWKTFEGWSDGCHSNSDWEKSKSTHFSSVTSMFYFSSVSKTNLWFRNFRHY